MFDDSKPLTVSTYGFNVPCRRFLITANITRDKRLPVVDEFVLRVLKLCERVPVKRLGAYFGLSKAETEIVMADLVARSLVVVEEDAVVLHASAHEHFRGAQNGSPRIMEIETWVERIWFDLVSQNMMKPERSRATRNLIEIKPNDMARDLPISFARKAFEENFTEYLRKVRRINNPDRFGLYSISGVEPGRFGFVVLKGREDLVFDPQPRLDPHLLDVDVDDVARFRALTNAMTDAYRRLTGPDPSAAALAEYMRLTGDQTVAEAHRETGVFNLAGWLVEQKTRANPERQPLVGASYVGRNTDLFFQLLERWALPRIKSETPREVELLWFRPAGLGWGASTDLQETVTNLRSLLRSSLSKAWTLRSSLISPQITRHENSRRFERVFDRGYFAPPGYLSPAIEVVLLRRIAGVVLVRVALTPSTSVVVGFVMVDPKSIEQLEARLHLEFLDQARAIWTAPKLESEEGQRPAEPAI